MANIEATELAVQEAADAPEFTTAALRAFHERLMLQSPHPQSGRPDSDSTELDRRQRLQSVRG
jgi:hypothetical protein